MRINFVRITGRDTMAMPMHSMRCIRSVMPARG